MLARWSLVALVACSSRMPGVTGDASGDSYTPTQGAALGMNDVTMLLPLPATASTPTLLAMTGTGSDLVPRALFTRVVTMPGDVGDTFEAFQLVALRFDLCDRADPGACPAGSDGRLRLVFQPMISTPVQANDVAVHAFYPIPAGQLAQFVDELRALAAMQTLPETSPLVVRPALAADYAAKLRALVLRYASADHLLRLTLFAQNVQTASINWAFRGVELHGAQFDDIVIPGISAAQQRAILVGSDPGYDVTPIADAPAGLATAMTSTAFGAASQTQRMTALDALAAAQNPMLATAQTVECIACHASTYLIAHRAATAGIDPSGLPSRFTAAYDLSIAAGMSTTNERSLRALGWLFDKPAISQRVANDTAQVLSEIAQRFPPAR